MRNITINGKKLPFRLSYRALKGSLAETGLSIHTMDNLDFSHLAIFGKNGVNAGYKFSDSKDSISLEDFEDLLDDDFSGLNTIGDAIAEEMKIINGEESESSDTEKK